MTNIQVPLLIVLKDESVILWRAIVVTNRFEQEKKKKQVERNQYGKEKWLKSLRRI